MSRDKAPVMTPAAANIKAMTDSPREFIRDPVMLEFLGLPNAGLFTACAKTIVGSHPQRFEADEFAGRALTGIHSNRAVSANLRSRRTVQGARLRRLHPRRFHLAAR